MRMFDELHPKIQKVLETKGLIVDGACCFSLLKLKLKAPGITAANLQARESVCHVMAYFYSPTLHEEKVHKFSLISR